jgi:hypothetical protein
MIWFHYPNGASSLQLDNLNLTLATDSVTAQFNLDPLIREITLTSGNDRHITRTPSQLTVASRDSSVTLVITNINFQKDSATVQVQSVGGYMLFRHKTSIK